MNRSLIFILIIFISSCGFSQHNSLEGFPDSTAVVNNLIDTNGVDPARLDSAISGLNFIKGTNYQNTKYSIGRLRSKLNQDYTAIIDTLGKKQFLDSVMGIFSHKLLNEIIPYWYGTEWDFEGHTAIPNEGKIACGYFVSTTLRDMGLNVNRYKLAQQHGLNEAKSIALNNTNNIIVYNLAQFNSVTHLLNEIEDGLYFVGLDYHVGYVYKKNNHSFFIHSNYYEDKVMIEVADFSPAFYSKGYYFCKISSNKELALKWIKNEEVIVVN